jgi:hypothetical protein
MLKKLQIIAFLLAVSIGIGLAGNSYINSRQDTQPQAAITAYDLSGLQVWGQEGDDPQIDPTAQIVIVAQETAEIGELIRFDLLGSTAESFKWLTVPETVDFEIYNNGQSAVFSPRKSGSHMFIVACAYDGSVDVTTHIVVIKGSVDSNDTVKPIKPVKPVDSDDEYPDINKPTTNNLSQWTVYWCSINKGKKEEAVKLAESFESIAAQISAGDLQTAIEITGATAEVNRRALGEALPKWLPVLRELQAAMKNLATEGKLSTPDQHRDLWSDIAQGLRLYVALFN